MDGYKDTYSILHATKDKMPSLIHGCNGDGLKNGDETLVSIKHFRHIIRMMVASPNEGHERQHWYQQVIHFIFNSCLKAGSVSILFV